MTAPASGRLRADPDVRRFRSRALAPVVGALGPRWTLVTDGDPAPTAELFARPFVTVLVADGIAAPGNCVRGALDAWPVLSESVTGALVCLADAGAAARACREASRVLQPGGTAIFVATWPAGAVRDFDEAVVAAKLGVVRRLAIRRADAAGAAWAWVERRRAASAQGAARIECAIVARRPGGMEPELPTAGGVLASMFVPRRWRRADGS